jgi:hypothetical protein
MEKKLITGKYTGTIIHIGYYPLLLLLSYVWRIYYDPDLDTMSMVSFAAQQVALFFFLQAADTLISRKKIKYALAGISALYIILLHLDAFLLSITSMTIYESIITLATGGDFLYTLEEAGLSSAFLFLLILIMILIAAVGGIIYKFIPYRVFGQKTLWFILIPIFIISTFYFIAEQSISRNSSNFYSRRVLPFYIEIYSSNKDTMTFSIPERDRRDLKEYTYISKPANPKNVLLILLESFRSDSVNAELSPSINELAMISLQFSNYFTDAIYTSLAWNVLLLDRPVFTLAYDISFDKTYPDGSGIFRIFKKAGYETFFASSANMEWKNFHERINGKDKLIDQYFCGYERREEERNHIDNRTSSKAAEWINRIEKTENFFMLIQLDSTHWTYYSDDENRISKPFAAKDVNIGKLKNPKDIELLYNRYKNSVRQINSGITKIISALKQSGNYNNTAIIIVSDHGEGFAPGMIGHSVMNDHIKKPAFIMHLPGVSKFSSDKFISHMDIFPTLFDYLKINGTNSIMKGKSIFDKDNNKKSILTFHGSILMADLTFKDYIVFFRIKNSKDSITFTPVKYTDREGNILKNHNNTEWKDEIEKIINNY